MNVNCTRMNGTCQEMRKINGCDMEKFGTFDSSEKPMAYPGEMVATDDQTGRRKYMQK